ncbi:MAG TPA: tetratricopeptide repeat protein [Xanthomonadales bacterium]|nr:tetratricopeptide repeat protein [Xanthomonadales bacterium]
MERKRTEILKLVSTLLVTLLLASCAATPPAPVEDRDEVEEEVRQPAQKDSAGVQVRPLQNPAVIELLAQAGDAEDQGRYDDATVLLERALRIQPHDPELLQQMAEVQLQQKDYEQALNFAVRSYDSGSRVGEICARNWRTISLARERLGDSGGSREAEQRAGQCMSTRPEKL